MDKQTMTEVEKEVLAKKLEEEKIIKEEKTRTVIEKYKIKKIGIWSTLPWLLLLGFVVYGAVITSYFNENFNWYPIIPIGAIGILMGLASTIEDKWGKRLSYKEKIYAEDESYRWIHYNYDDEYIYTDLDWDSFWYRTAKATAYLVNCGFIVLAGILGFLWLGSITIAPTTIIIILLIIIIENQNRER